MKRAIIIAAMLAATGLAGAQMFAQLFGATGTPIPSVAWYKLDGNALDSSGNGYDGTWSGTECYTDGPYAGRSAGCFDGNSWVATPITNQVASGLFASTESRWTLGVWARVAANKQGAVVARAGTTANQMTANLLVDLNTNNPAFVLRGAGVNRSPTAGKDGEWRHYALAWDGATALFYLDGVHTYTVPVGRAAEEVGQEIIIGARTGGSVFRLTGAIADVRIYDRALSEDNIKRIMESQDNEPLEELQ